MERRSLLKTIGGIGAASAAGLGGMAALGGSAAAVSQGLNIGNSQVSNDDGDLSEVIVNLDHTVEWDGFDVGVDAISYTDVISITDGSGTDLGAYTLYDGAPVDLTEIVNGNWGGPGETGSIYATDEDNSSPGANALAGSVSADVNWTVLTDQSNTPSANSVQTPAVIGQDVGNLDNNTDGSDRTFTVTFEKTISFYTENTDGSYTQMADGDGTVAQTTAAGSFQVTVGNESATTTAGSSNGSSSAS